MLFGLMAEVGEIADKIAKWRRKECAGWIWIIWCSMRVICKRWRGTNRADERGRGLCVVYRGIADCFGLTLEEVMQQNLDNSPAAASAA